MKLTPENLKKAEHLLSRKTKAENATKKDAVHFAGIKLMPYFRLPDEPVSRDWPPMVATIDVEAESPLFKAVLAAYLKEAKREAELVEAELTAMQSEV